MGEAGGGETRGGGGEEGGGEERGLVGAKVDEVETGGEEDSVRAFFARCEYGTVCVVAIDVACCSVCTLLFCCVTEFVSFCAALFSVGVDVAVVVPATVTADVAVVTAVVVFVAGVVAVVAEVVAVITVCVTSTGTSFFLSDRFQRCFCCPVPEAQRMCVAGAGFGDGV